jgi:tRNA A-37 threonylcarbamoyl transferase component Bud32
MPHQTLRNVGRYEIVREIGRGAMAVVYLAHQTDLDRQVALKELAAFHAADPNFAERFVRESRYAGSLSHPNIVTVHDYFENDGTPFIAMELVERGSLRPYVRGLRPAQIVGVLEGLLAGLAHAGAAGIVHRDLKPENLMITADGRVKIADFGIAKASNKLATGAFLTATGSTVGTPAYMAPEQAMASEIGPWTDLYSVGCIAYELFTGAPPFSDTTAPMAVLLKHVNEPVPPARSVDPSVDPRISDWIDRLLVKEPADRTQTAGEAWDELEEITISLLGPRWRRDARLVESVVEKDTPRPLTPAPFAEVAEEVEPVAPPEPVAAEPVAPRVAEPEPTAPPSPPAAVPNQVVAKPLAAQRRRPPWLLLGGIGAALAAIVVLVVVLAGGGGKHAPKSTPVAKHVVRGPSTAASGPSAAYAGEVTGAITTLNASFSSGSSRLKLAKTPAGQTRAARALAVAFRTAAASLAGAQPSAKDAPANGRLVAAFTGAANAYNRLSVAAKRRNRRAFVLAERAVRIAQAEITVATSALIQNGYELSPPNLNGTAPQLKQTPKRHAGTSSSTTSSTGKQSSTTGTQSTTQSSTTQQQTTHTKTKPPRKPTGG